MLAILESESDWFNIPGVVKEAFRRMQLELQCQALMMTKLHKEHDDTRISLGEWSKYVQTIEVDVCERFVKLETNVANQARDLEDLESTQVSFHNSVHESLQKLSHDFAQLRSYVAMEREERRAQIASLKNSFTHHDEELKTTSRAFNSLQSFVSDRLENFDRILTTEMQTVSQQFHALAKEMHKSATDTVSAISNIKGSFLDDMVAMSNRISGIDVIVDDLTKGIGVLSKESHDNQILRTEDVVALPRAVSEGSLQMEHQQN